MTELGELQRWFVEVLQRPAGHAEAISSRVKGGGTGLSAVDRMGIYGRSYYLRLVQALETEFPVLCESLGAELFDHFAMGYIAQYPPQDYTLNRLGEHFPQFLHESRPQEQDQWAQFIVELAHLERLISEVYHGEGHEHSDLPPEQDTAEILQEPWTRTMQCSFGLHAYYVAMRQAITRGEDTEELELPGASPCRLAIFRRDYKVKIRTF